MVDSLMATIFKGGGHFYSFGEKKILFMNLNIGYRKIDTKNCQKWAKTA